MVAASMNVSDNPALDEEPLKSDSTFTIEGVEALLQKHVFRTTGPLASLRMPSQEAMAELASYLNTFRRHFQNETGPFQADREVRERFSKAITELTIVIPLLRDINNKSTDQITKLRGNDNEDIISKSILKQNEKYEAMLIHMDESIKLTQGRDLTLLISLLKNPLGLDNWHEISSIIAVFLKEAILSTNPHATLGLSNNGPAARFIAAVLPNITGDRLESGTVGKWLKENPPSDWDD